MRLGPSLNAFNAVNNAKNNKTVANSACKFGSSVGNIKSDLVSPLPLPIGSAMNSFDDLNLVYKLL